MKKFRYFFLALAALSLAAVSCQPEEEPFEPGEPDVAGCYGVYFPVQDASGAHTYDPTMPTTVEFTVKRTNSSGAITVPVKYTESESGMFQVGALSFADGQSETTLKVDFPNTGIGTTYSLSLLIDDPQYASQYNDGAVSIDFSVLRVEWIDMKDPKTNQTATVTFTESYFGFVVEAKVKYYEVNGVRTCETYDEKVVASDFSIVPVGNKGMFGCGDNNHLHFTWYAKSDWIDVPKQFMGFDYNDGDWKPADEGVGSSMYVYDWFNYYITDGGYAGSWPDWETFLSKNPGAADRSYYDGNGGFMISVRYYIPGLGGWSPDPNNIVGIVSGYTRVDYTIKALENDFSKEGAMPVYLYTGVDVTKAAFVAAAGELTATQVANQVNAIAEGTAENVVTLEEFVDAEYMEEAVKAAAAEITLPETGVYTLVAVTFDGDGKVADSASSVAKYVAAGDEEANAVDLTCGIGSAAKYVGQGYNTDTSVEVWAYGTDIVDAKIAAVKYADLAGNMSGVLAALKEAPSVSEEIIADINDKGYVGVASKLLPGTKYYTVIWASNGYSEGYFISDDGIYTTGDPLPIYQEFIYSDYNEDFVPEDQSVFVGKTFNMYATDLFGTLGMNEYIGKVTISDSEYEDEGPDDYGLLDEYVTVTGLSGSAAEEYGFDDSVTFDLYGGYLYMAENNTVDGEVTVYNMNGAGSCYNAAYNAYFIPVMDGYYAYVCNSKYYSAYNWNGLAFYSGGFLAAMVNYILVDPEKDDNGLAPASSARLSSQVNFKVKGAVDSHKVARERFEKGVKVYSNLNAVSGECPVKTVEVRMNTIAPKAVFSSKEVKRYITVK